MVARARQAARYLNRVETNKKNDVLLALAERLREQSSRIIDANRLDIEEAVAQGLNKAMTKRLELNEKKIAAMADGLDELVRLADPVGQVEETVQRPNGLEIRKVRVPFGVIGIIYESRPNVTIDAAALCLKAGNASLLRGGREAVQSNRCLVELFREALQEFDFPVDAVQLVVDPDRSLFQQMLRMHGQIDLLIPRGGSGLIQSVVQNATVPVIETGIGNCHVYIHARADLQKAIDISVNAKISNPAVCNAVETLLVDRAVAAEFLPKVAPELFAHEVELHVCSETMAILKEHQFDNEYVHAANEEDWATEYLDLICAVKVVDGLDEAINHIQQYGSGHSDAIVTEDYSAARRFVKEVDSAAVYVNASTRFTDGYEFGYGAEIGISTQKLHARGPMGLRELTTVKNVIFGDGQIR